MKTSHKFFISNRFASPLQHSFSRGFTLVEMSVVVALSTVVFGLILSALVETSRASEQLISNQQMRQEALLIAQGVERAVRYRVDAGELVVAQAGDLENAPASVAAVTGPTTATATTASNVPLSLVGTLPTTAAASQTPAGAEQTPAAADLTSVPATIRPLMSTTGTANLDRPPAGEEEHYGADELTLYSLSAGAQSGRLLTAIRNSRGLPNELRHAYVERSVPEGVEGPGVISEQLGGNPDRFQSSVTFRYASEYEGLEPRWQKRAKQIPRLIEYTVHVWPVGTGNDFAAATDAQGRPAAFKYVSAVSVR